MDRMEVLFVTLVVVGLICMFLIDTDKFSKNSEKKVPKEADKLVSLMVLNDYKLNLTEIMKGVPKLKPQYLWDVDIHGASTLSPVITVSILDTANAMHKTGIATIQAERDEWIPDYNLDHKLWYDASREDIYDRDGDMKRMMGNWYTHIQKHIITKTPVEYTRVDNTDFSNFQF